VLLSREVVKKIRHNAIYRGGKLDVGGGIGAGLNKEVAACALV
jgi:hypothetical protein